MDRTAVPQPTLNNCAARTAAPHCPVAQLTGNLPNPKRIKSIHSHLRRFILVLAQTTTATTVNRAAAIADTNAPY